MIFLSAEKAARCRKRITEIPDAVVEVVSPDSRQFDRQTKKRDYEQAGVQEYWIIDPERRTFLFYRLSAGRFVEIPPTGMTFPSEVIAGFVLDLVRLQTAYGEP